MYYGATTFGGPSPKFFEIRTIKLCYFSIFLRAKETYIRGELRGHPHPLEMFLSLRYERYAILTYVCEQKRHRLEGWGCPQLEIFEFTL